MNTSATKPTSDSQKLFGHKLEFPIYSLNEESKHIPEIDKTYHFDYETTSAICAGFAFNKRVLVQGFHGTGKSTHIEQIASRLNWPCLRLNLDSHVSRLDFLGKDAIVLEDGKQITKFKEGILPWCMQNGVALVLDEYDAGRPEIMFVIQRVLEENGKLTLPDQNKVIVPHKNFRIFATSNTIGLGDSTGIYHGTQPINQGQMDRWNIVVALNYIEPAFEKRVITSKVPDILSIKGIEKDIIDKIIKLANLIRQAFINNDISTVMSPRNSVNWAKNIVIFKDTEKAFKFSFLNRCDDAEKSTINELYQRCFNKDLLASTKPDNNDA